jgi:hypothetical protein
LTKEHLAGFVLSLQFFTMESQNSEPEKECENSLETTFAKLGFQEENQELEKTAAVEEGAVKLLSKHNESKFAIDTISQTLNGAICKCNKNAEPEKENDTSMAKTSSKERKELEKISVAVEKEESSFEAGAKLIPEIDEIIQPFNKQICENTKNAITDENAKNESVAKAVPKFGLPEKNQAGQQTSACVEKPTLEVGAEKIYKLDFCDIDKIKIKNTKHKNHANALTVAEFVLPERNQELEKILTAVEKGESSLEGGAEKISKLSDNFCDVDKITQFLTEEICKRTENNAVPIFMYIAISEGLLNIFNIGSGAAKLDFTAIRYLQSFKLLDS